MTPQNPRTVTLADDVFEQVRQRAEAEGKSVEDIATACGYDSASRIAEQFRRSEGVSPSEYRARHRESANDCWSDEPALDAR